MRIPFIALAALAALIMAPHASAATADAELARQKNCLACHAIDKPLLGPAYLDVAAKYRSQPKAVDALTLKVLKGGFGVWGTMSMPPNAVTPAEARRLVLWVMSLTPGAAVPPVPVPVAQTVPRVAAKAPDRRADARTLQRGKYLVNSVLSCGNCHSPRTADNAVIVGRELSGGRTYDSAEYYVTPGNLTSDVETGLGSWSVDDLKRALTKGVRPNGLPLAPMMPVSFFKAMTDEDLNAVAAYVLSLPPRRNPTPAPVYRKAFHSEQVPDAKRPFAAREAAGDLITRGRYLGTLGHCLDCHTPVVDGKTDFVANGGRGGKLIGLNKLLAPNITSHPTAGLGAWSDAEIRRALTQGVSRDGRRLEYPMPWQFFATLNEDDVKALVAWLRTLPPKE